MKSVITLIALCSLSGCTTYIFEEQVDRLVGKPFYFNRALFDGDLWDAHRMFREGSRMMEQYRFSEAKAVFKDLIYKYPESAIINSVYLKLGVCCFELKEYERTSDYLSRYLRGSEHIYEDPRVYFTTAESYANNKKYNEALYYLDLLEKNEVMTNQDTIRLALLRGFYNYGLRRMEEAEYQVRRCIDYFSIYRSYLPGIADWEIAKTYFIYADIHTERVLLQKVRSENIDMAGYLAEKSEDVRIAEDYFRRAIEVGDSSWAVKSLERYAQLYSGLYLLLKNNYQPDRSLQAGQRNALISAHYQQVGKILKKSQMLYQRAISLALDLDETVELRSQLEKELREIETELKSIGFVEAVRTKQGVLK